MALLHCCQYLLNLLRMSSFFECVFICFQNRTLFYLDVLVKELESISLTLLTLPPLHLAEVIACNLSLSKSHSDLYRLRYWAILLTCHSVFLMYLCLFVILCCIITVYLDRLFSFFRIVKTCCELGLESSSPYKEALLSFAHIPEDEQML